MKIRQAYLLRGSCYIIAWEKKKKRKHGRTRWQEQKRKGPFVASYSGSDPVSQELH